MSRTAYTAQPPFTTPDALNVWPTQWETGRERGGSRPGLTATGSVGSAPYNWCTATWSPVAGGTRREIAVVHASGTSVSNGAGSWSEYITTNPTSDFATCAVYLQKLYQADGGDTGVVRWVDLKTGVGVGTTLTASVGTAPTKCGLVTVWNDRLLLAGDYANPHMLYASRIGFPLDWQVADIDQGAAWATSGVVGGIITDPITSLIPHNRDCLLVGCTDSLWVIRGNPMAGGQAYVLSHEVGPLMQSASCKTGNDYELFLTRDGLYSMKPGCGEPPISVSREKIPDALMAINPENGDHASMGYDHRWRGVHIYVNYNSGDNVYYFYDLQSGGFWPMTFVQEMRLCPSLRRAATTTKSSILPTSSSGQMFQFDTASTESFTSRLFYGPFRLGGEDRKGHILETRAALGTGTDTVSWAIRTGASAEESYTNPDSFVGSDWQHLGLNYAQHPRVGGSFAGVVTEATGTDRISIEEITLLLRDGGRRRVQ